METVNEKLARLNVANGLNGASNLKASDNPFDDSDEEDEDDDIYLGDYTEEEIG